MRVVGHAVAALTAAAALPVAAGALLWQPRWRIGLDERLGRSPEVATGAVWIHAASVGEILASRRLVDALRARGHSVFTTTATLDGRDVMRRARPDVPCHLAPIDHPWCVESTLRRLEPAALVIVETELWPVRIAAAERQGVPVLLVSARLSDRSFPRYRRLGRLAGPTLRRIRRVGARTELDRDRFVSLGVPADRIEITGDLKLEPVEQAAPLSPDLSEVLGVRPLVVAGSTHPGEEEQVLDALSAATGAQESALVIAPRHVQRAIEVERLVRSRGRSVRRRTTSQPRPLAAGEVLILDTVGELAAVYARAAVAFVGGTLVPVGGHNVLEPASAGCPVLHGPHVANIRHAVELLEACDAARIVKSVADLAGALSEILGDPEAAAKRGERAIAMLREHRGCTDRTAELVDAVLSENAAD